MPTVWPDHFHHRSMNDLALAGAATSQKSLPTANQWTLFHGQAGFKLPSQYKKRSLTWRIPMGSVPHIEKVGASGQGDAFFPPKTIRTSFGNCSLAGCWGTDDTEVLNMRIVDVACRVEAVEKKGTRVNMDVTVKWSGTPSGKEGWELSYSCNVWWQRK